MQNPGTTLCASIDVALERSAAFEVLVEELAMALRRLGIGFEPGSNSRVTQGAVEVGRVISWKPGESIKLQWRPANWEPQEITEVELRFEPVDGGTRITLEHRGWGRLLGDGGEIAGWFAGEVAAPLLRATTPAGLGDWITDRQARRPSGAGSRSVYRDPLYHYPNFRAILD